MDGSGAPPNQTVLPSFQQQQQQQQQQQPQQPLHQNLIRTDQVQKIPQLDQKQKLDHINVVRGLWEIINTRDAQSTEYHNAVMRLTQISQNLMRGMRQFQQAMKLQGQGQRPAGNPPQNFAQLFPQVQQRVNMTTMFPPTSLAPEQIQQWLQEARYRYGVAHQKIEVGRARIQELRNHVAQKQGPANMTQQEIQEARGRQTTAERLVREGNDFVTKFHQQQEAIKGQRASQQFNQSGANAGAVPQNAIPASQPHAQAQTGLPANQGPISGETQLPTSTSTTNPAPHTVNSAVTAARNQASQQIPTTPVPVQVTQGQTPTQQIPIPSGAPSQSHPPTAVTQSGQTQPQRPQVNPSVPASVPAPVAAAAAAAASTTTASRPQVQQVAAKLEQSPYQSMPATQNYSAAQQQNHQQQQQQQLQQVQHQQHQQQQQKQQQSAMNQNAQQQNYTPNQNSENSSSRNNMPPKNFPPPEPVPMPPARPTLSGGPSHGAMGMMGQPAIQKHPGYVLEGEGQRVLSKKMLDILVRQVTGGGSGEGLTPDAEEVPPLPIYKYPQYNTKSQT